MAQQINTRFLDVTTGVYRARPSATGAVGDEDAHATSARDDTQCGQGMALFSQLCPDSATCERSRQVLAQNARSASFLPAACQGSASLPGCKDARGGPGAHLTAGLFGIKWVLLALADGGMNDLALEMLTSSTFPSFGWVRRSCTTPSLLLTRVGLDCPLVRGAQPDLPFFN